MRFFVCAVFTAVFLAVGAFVLRPVHVPLSLPPMATTTTPTPPPAWPTATDDEDPGRFAQQDATGFRSTGSGSARAHDGNVGSARQMAERAARLDAARNLTAHILRLPLTDGRLVKDAVAIEVVREATRQFKITDTRYFTDGSVDVDVHLERAVIDAAIAPARLR